MHINQPGHQRNVVAEINDPGIIRFAGRAQPGLIADGADAVTVHDHESMSARRPRNTVIEAPGFDQNLLHL
jgi:hypothetical protein